MAGVKRQYIRPEPKGVALVWSWKCGSWANEVCHSESSKFTCYTPRVLDAGVVLIIAPWWLGRIRHGMHTNLKLFFFRIIHFSGGWAKLTIYCLLLVFVLYPSLSMPNPGCILYPSLGNHSNKNHCDCNVRLSVSTWRCLLATRFAMHNFQALSSPWWEGLLRQFGSVTFDGYLLPFLSFSSIEKNKKLTFLPDIFEIVCFLPITIKPHRHTSLRSCFSQECAMAAHHPALDSSNCCRQRRGAPTALCWFLWHVMVRFADMVMTGGRE